MSRNKKPRYWTRLDNGIYLKILFTKYIPTATAGPMPKANKIVPNPAVPPNSQPKKTTLTSIIALISATGTI